MKWLKKLINLGLGKGFRVGWSSGKAFDPRDQERTDAMDDLLHPRKKESNMPNRDGKGPRGGGGKKSGRGRGGC